MDNNGLPDSNLNELSINCDICKKSFKFKSDFTRHRRVHTGEKLYKCKDCDKIFKQIGHLTTHMLVNSGKK